MDTKKLLACFDNDCKYLHEVYAKEIQFVIDNLYQINMPTVICKEISVSSHSKQELPSLLKIHFWYVLKEKLGFQSWNYTNSRILLAGSNLFYALDFILISKHFYYKQQLKQKHLIQLVSLRFLWLLYTIVVYKLFNVQIIGKMLENATYYGSLATYYKTYVINHHKYMAHFASKSFALSLFLSLLLSAKEKQYKTGRPSEMFTHFIGLFGLVTLDPNNFSGLSKNFMALYDKFYDDSKPIIHS